MNTEHAIEVDRPIEAVFDFVADARNDPVWCSRVKWCRQTAGEGPGPGARYETLHRPTRLKPAQTRSIEVIEFDRPTLIRWRQEDDNGVFTIGYSLEPVGDGVRFIQRDAIDWKIPWFYTPIAKRTVDAHISRQLRDLARLLGERVP